MRLKSDVPTDIVLVSFHAKWHRDLPEKLPNVVFRRKVPARPIKRMFMYVNSPIAAIVGCATVSKVNKLERSDARNIVGKSGLDVTELDEYLGTRDSISAYHLTTMKFFAHALPLGELQKLYAFFPPQSFLYVDRAAAEELMFAGTSGIRNLTRS